MRRHPKIERARLMVGGEMGADTMTLIVETALAQGDALALATRVTETVRDVTQLRSKVQCVAPGQLANDGKVIEDIRNYA